jgi:hypothetical protein
VGAPGWSPLTPPVKRNITFYVYVVYTSSDILRRCSKTTISVQVLLLVPAYYPRHVRRGEPQGRCMKLRGSYFQENPDAGDRFSAWKTKPWIIISLTSGSCEWDQNLSRVAPGGHLGIETQRQWSDSAVFRTTPQSREHSVRCPQSAFHGGSPSSSTVTRHPFRNCWQTGRASRCWSGCYFEVNEG